MSFKKVAAKIAKKGGYSKKAASAILASASLNASPEAKKNNPNLKKVKGKGKSKLNRQVRKAKRQQRRAARKAKKE